MESVVNVQTRCDRPKSTSQWDDPRPKRALLICAATLGLVGIAILGVIRLFQCLNDGTISAWRLALLFANAFFCVMVICALYGRGRQRPRPAPVPRRRS